MVGQDCICILPFLVFSEICILTYFRDGFLYSQVLKRFVASRQRILPYRQLCSCHYFEHICEVLLQKAVFKTSPFPENVAPLFNSHLLRWQHQIGFPAGQVLQLLFLLRVAAEEVGIRALLSALKVVVIGNHRFF